MPWKEVFSFSEWIPPPEETSGDGLRSPISNQMINVIRDRSGIHLKAPLSLQSCEPRGG